MSLPRNMQVVEISQPGGPEVLKPAIAAVPQPRHGEVLIRVAAAGVNRPDCLQRSGLYPVPPDADPLPGLEVAGEVVAVGSGDLRYRQGDTVCALVHGGGYAQYVRADARHCLPVPAGIDTVHAAAIPETFFTVYYNMIMRCGLRAGETLLVHGGSSGIGTTAIQMAVALGATVFTTAGSAEKCAFCRDTGATLAINYREQDFATAVTDAGGADVVLDMVGGPYIQKNIDVLKRDGRYAFIAFLGGPRAEVNFLNVLRNRLTVTGSTLRPQSADEKAAIADGLERDIWPLLRKGDIVPIIDSIYPLADAAAAHSRMESSEHMGKIVLRVAE